MEPAGASPAPGVASGNSFPVHNATPGSSVPPGAAGTAASTNQDGGAFRPAHEKLRRSVRDLLTEAAAVAEATKANKYAQGSCVVSLSPTVTASLPPRTWIASSQNSQQSATKCICYLCVSSLCALFDRLVSGLQPATTLATDSTIANVTNKLIGLCVT